MNDNGRQPELSELIGIVAKKMGKTPEELEHELKSGTLPQNEQIKELLGDKQKLQGFLATPQVQQMLRELGKK